MPTARRRPSANEQMLGLLTGYWVSQLIFVAARLGIADALGRGAMAPAAIAKKVGAHPPYVRRLLRALASVDIFAETPDGKFRMTPLAETLKRNEPGSLRPFALMVVDNYNWAAWGALEHGIRTGELPFDHVHKMPAFAYLQQHPEKEREFSASMASISGPENAAVAQAYPFSKFSTMVDVGGAHGHLVSEILTQHRNLRGVLYDQPAVVSAATHSGFITNPVIRGRCATVGGDFFREVPAGADLYVLKYIIHDWDDEKAIRILRNCREGMKRDGRVLVVEHVIPPGNGADWGKLLDINMMVVPGGQERTKLEFQKVMAKAGLTLKRVLPTTSPLSIVEATRT